VTSTQYVAALGRLEPDGGILSIGAPAGQTLKSLLVEEGQFVSRDEPLAHLSSYDSLQAECERTRSALDDATEQLRTTEAYSAALVEEAQTAVDGTGKPLDLEVQTLEAEVTLLRAHLDIAVKDRERLEKSHQDMSSGQLDRQKLVEQRAQRDLTAAEKRLDQLRESAQMRRAQAQAQLQTAIANQKRMDKSISVESAKKNVARAEAQLDQAVIRAPRDGKVLKILAREGATLGGRAILQLGDTRKMNVIAEVYETDVRHVHQGQTATISSAALPEELPGTVEKVLWTIERNTIRDLNPTAPEDLRVVEVKIRLDEEDVTEYHDLLETLINLQVHVRIKKD
jgi:HlyD family secretion protein